MPVNQTPDISGNIEHERVSSLIPFMVAAVMGTTASSVYAQSSTESAVSPTPVVTPANAANQQSTMDTSKIVIPGTTLSSDNPAPTDKQGNTSVAIVPQTIVTPSTITYQPYLGAENYETGCRTVENYAGTSSLLQIMVNGKAMDLVSFKAKDGTSDIVIPKTRTRMWAFGRCFDIFEGQIYPVNISPEGKVVGVNSYGGLLSGIKKPDGETLVGGYNGIRKMIVMMNDGLIDKSDGINTVYPGISGNSMRLLSLMKEDPQLIQKDSQDAFFATLLQLQLILIEKPGIFLETFSQGEKDVIVFLEAHKNPSFIKPEEIELYTKVHSFVSENMYKKSEKSSIVAQK